MSHDSTRAATNEAPVLEILKRYLGQPSNVPPLDPPPWYASSTVAGLSALFTAALVGFIVAYLGWLSAGSSLPSWLTQFFSTSGQSGWDAGASIALVFIATTVAFTLLGWFLHVFGTHRAASIRDQLDAEVAKVPAEEKMGKEQGANVEQWVTFLQGRADSKSSWVQSLSLLGGLVPASALLQTIPPLHATLLTATAAGIVAGFISGWTFWAIRKATLDREAILLVMILVLGGFLREDRHITMAYLWVASAPRKDKP